jgi:hypothetical protein
VVSGSQSSTRFLLQLKFICGEILRLIPYPGGRHVCMYVCMYVKEKSILNIAIKVLYQKIAKKE